MSTLNILTAPAAVREYLAGESPALIEWAGIVAYYFYDSWTPTTPDTPPLERSREEWRLRYAVHLYESAVRDAKQSQLTAEKAASQAASEPPHGRWRSVDLVDKAKAYVSAQGGSATLKGLGLTRKAEYGRSYEHWVTYTAAERESIRRGRIEGSANLAAAARDAAERAARLLSPPIAEWIAVRDGGAQEIAQRVERLRALCAAIEQANQHGGHCQQIVASYVRDLGADRAAWPKHIQEVVAALEARQMPREAREALRTEARAAYAAIMEINAADYVARDAYLGTRKRRNIYAP
jgi:hypothetical protein